MRNPFLHARRDLLAKTPLSAGAAAMLATSSALAQSGQDVTWQFDRLDNIGGNPAHVDGQPKIVTTPAGKAVLFDGVHDGLFIDKHPLAGFSQFTFEALVRPDGGDPAQRRFHLAETDPKTGLDATTDPNNPTADKNSRFTFELRVDGDRCYFESFTHGPGYQSALIDKTKTHPPLGQWYVVTQTYDGQTHRSFVNGVLEKEARRRAHQSRFLFQGRRDAGAFRAACAGAAEIHESAGVTHQREVTTDRGLWGKKSERIFCG
jgi:hypothetical protein